MGEGKGYLDCFVKGDLVFFIVVGEGGHVVPDLF